MCNFLIKRIAIQNFMDKINSFFNTLPFSPWAVLATWHMAPQKLQEK
jgi:hypothetical protein